MISFVSDDICKVNVPKSQGTRSTSKYKNALKIVCFPVRLSESTVSADETGHRL